MMQRLHSHKVISIILIVAAICGTTKQAFAQLSENAVNSEYREIILQELQKSVQKREATMRNKAFGYLTTLPNNRKLYDESKLNIKADLVNGIRSDGRPELNYRIVVDYVCHHLESVTDNYPTGRYLCEESNAATALCEMVRVMVDELGKDAFKSGKKVTVKIRTSTDITEVTHLDYGGEYGDYQYCAARYNGESVRISVSQASGIQTNAQLAFLRAQGIRQNLIGNVKSLQATDNEFFYETRSESETGSQYRNVGIEIVVHGAFDEEIVLMNEQLINDEFIDYNIPKVAENSNDKTYVLIVANEKYGEPLPDVPYAYNDGEVLLQYCVRTLGIPARQVKIIEDATLKDIRHEGVDWMKNIAIAKKGDVNFIIYFAGHGFSDADHNPYMAPAGIDYKKVKALKGKKAVNTDVRLSPRDSKKLLEQCLRVDTLCAWFNRVQYNALTIILDASFDGNQRDGHPLINMKHSDKKAKAIRIRNDVVLFSAAAYDKTAYAFDEQHHGFYTYFILKELKKSKGDINYYDLFNSVDLQLQQESSLQGILQEPTVTVGGKLKDRWGELRLR